MGHRTQELQRSHLGPARRQARRDHPARTTSQTHLAAIADKAIQLLDRHSQGAKKGFFLQIEGTSIDKQDHAATSCATAPLTGSQQHTGTQVRIAAGGPQAANVLGVTDQTQLFHTIRRALGLSQ